MRVAVFSDVHGNCFALEAVWADVQDCTPDVVANLGDQVYGSADPAGAYALQRSMGAIEVRGNTEELYTADVRELEGARRQVEWLREQLPEAAVTHLRALPVTAALAEGEVVLAHGNLTSPWDALMFTQDDGVSRSRQAAPEELLARVADFPGSRVVVVGHTHQELIRSRAGVTFVNAGAVSRQMHGDPAARWVLLERRRGQWNVTFRRVEYDWEAAARWVEQNTPFGAMEAGQLRTGHLE